MKKAIQAGQFRQDLYYRLTVVPLHLPALVERKEDVPLLAHHCLKKVVLRSNKALLGFTLEALDLMRRYDYPGNIRELKSIVHSTLNLTQGRHISKAFLPKNVLRAKKISTAEHHSTSEPLVPLAHAEKNYILKVYREMDRNKSKTARVLGIALNTLRKKIESYGVK